MIIIQLYLAFLCFLADALREETECQHLVNEFDGVVTNARKICLIVVPRGNYVHMNITMESHGFLVVDGIICQSEATKDVVYDVEYVYLTFRLTTIAPNERCPLDSVGVMQLVFQSDSLVFAAQFSVKVIENYENKRNGKSKDDMNTAIAMNPISSIIEKLIEFLNEFRIILIACFGVVFILLLVFLCCYKFVDYKFKNRLRATENELEQIRHNQFSQGIELSVLSKNEPDHSANLKPSDHSDNSMFELNSH